MGWSESIICVEEELPEEQPDGRHGELCAAERSWVVRPDGGRGASIAAGVVEGVFWLAVR